MRLQSLEIKGFKSFANDTKINFGQDVIGIVGPNGSGKSNIVDAIRWVLGEQKSSELRLDQMSSVIFNGTKKRKQGGLAQVSLTFDNTKNLLPTEYQSITITRMLYRSGESEYRLNGVACRLKDITSLFLDTGIGSNSYAIIALGMVDDILADKDDSRRKMFEQAAGVSKYKIRKKQTLNKLKSTTEDLDRIEDLLFEINANLETLEKQAKRAEKYFELKNEYKKLSVDMAILKVASLKVKQNELKATLEKEEDKYREYDVVTRKLEAQLEHERKANVDKEKALSESQRELNSLIGHIRGMENDKRMMEQKQEFLEQNMQKSNQDIQSASGRMAQLEGDIEHFRSELNLSKREEARLEEELEGTELALKKVKESHGSIKAELDDIVNSQQEAERALFSLEKQKAVNANEIDNYQRLIEQNRLDIELRVEEVNSLKLKIEAIRKEEEGKARSLENLEKAEAGRVEEIRLTEQELDTLQKTMTRVNRELDAKRNEFKLTQSMIENLEGFPESIRFLSGSKEWKKDTPLLSDIIYVKEEYRIAIENFLEPYLNYYVAQNLEEAQQAIRLLSRSQKGKANFFILEAFAHYEAPMKMLPGTKHAIDLVETDMNYRRLCGYLLENVLITDNEQFEIHDMDEDVTILSKSGSFIRRKFSVSGGSVGLFEGKKIGRKKNLEILDSSIKKLEREENKFSTAFYNLKSKIDHLKTGNHNPEIHQERNALNQLSQERISLATRLENFQTFIAEADAKFQKSSEAIKTLEASNISIDKDLEEKMNIVRGVKDQIANMDGSYREVAEELSTASANFNQKNIAFIQQQNRVGALQRELVFREKQLEETLTAMDANQRQLRENSEEIKRIQSGIDELQNSLLTKYEERKAKESSLTEVEQLYFSGRGGINEIEDKLRQTGRARQDAQILINQIKEKYTDIKFQVSSVAQRLKIEFEMDINSIINQDPEDPNQDPEELEMKVDRMRRRLENYGEINPMAVEAYNEMKDRFDSITKQRNDIVEAKDSLIATIKEIEETATIQFLDSFSKARLYFIDVFRSLFTEDDNCDLILLEPDNPLESKIEIVAKPKGKRPQTISQLSGGEKTLTAIALLFALYLLKPAPFCIFDEVDAPLDDANILKFNKIIKKFSTESQFIIVTHNKLTMASVDTIYGVYMAEQGVSGVSPVDFRDFEHKATFEVSR